MRIKPESIRVINGELHADPWVEKRVDGHKSRVREINGFVLGPNQHWMHETLPHIPDGYRPHILGELDAEGDRWRIGDGDWYNLQVISMYPSMSTHNLRITKRPVPAVLTYGEANKKE